VDECKPLAGGAPQEVPAHDVRGEVRRAALRGGGRGLHSSTLQLNLSALYGIGGARRDCVARVKGVLGGVQGVQGVQGVVSCQTRLKLS